MRAKNQRKLFYIVHNTVMTTKEIALKTIEQLPANASREDIQERLNFVVAVRKNLRDLDKKKVSPTTRSRKNSPNGLQADLGTLCLS
jgi:hypothetical protein